MIQPTTLYTLIQLATPLVACGALEQSELDELKVAVRQSKEDEGPKFPRLVRIQEAADYLGVSKKAIHDYIKDGKLKRIKFGHRSARITADSIAQFLQDSQK